MKRPRLVDVARLAGVTPAVVSIVLRNKTDSSIRVSAATAERVRKAVEELGYTPNLLARGLAVGRKHVLGVFSFEPLFASDTSDHYLPFLRGIEEECEKRGQDVLLVTHPSRDPEKRSVYVDGVNRMDFADGAILFGTEHDRREVRRLLDDGYPFVFIGRREVDGRPLPSVIAAYADATETITRAMIEKGHSRLVYLGLPLTKEYVTDREAGFWRALDANDLRRSGVVWRGPLGSLTKAKIAGLFKRGTTGFVVETPAYTRRLIERAQEIGLEQGKDYSFGVLSDVFYAERCDPDWTTLVVPRAAMGRLAVRLLLDRLEDPNHALSLEESTVPCGVRLTGSVAQAPARG